MSKRTLLCLLLSAVMLPAQDVLTLADGATRLVFSRGTDGWRASEVVALRDGQSLPVGQPSGTYTLLFAEQAPSAEPVGPGLEVFYDVGAELKIPHLERKWANTTDAVSLNVAGEAFRFLPGEAERLADGSLRFRHDTPVAGVELTLALDPAFPGDVRATLVVTAKRTGFFSLATPALVTFPAERLAWAVVPGYFQGAAIEPNLLLSYGYGQGLPPRPVVVRERTASTLSSLATDVSGATLAVTAEPGTAAEPWGDDHDTRQRWQLGLSHMTRAGELSPTLYHPVLGQADSHLAAGERRSFLFRYTVRAGDWFEVNRHVIQSIYRFADGLALREPSQSLTDRVRAQHRYLTDDQTSLWRVEEFEGVRLGAQIYRGLVAGAAKPGDSIKNSDYGAMWMLARITGDPKLREERLPYARNFKLKQVQGEPGFFQGAAVGQYYLPSSRRFAEEWGDYVEPVALTYYALLDLGNILLFEPGDAEARTRFTLAAERLLAWQKTDGRWEVGYRRHDERPVFTDLNDYRPTFYGLLVAYRILGDARYLAAARKGADWLVAHAVNPGRFLGVCGDARFVPDFATAQIAQALLDLHEVTGEVAYRDAGIAAARFYTTSIYTHPVAKTAPRQVKGRTLPEWMINQSGLSFEHGGLLGSAVNAGPILLASHAGLFLRVYRLTGETLFRDFARSAAIGREAFVDPETKVASYYWRTMNAGAGPFPHHAWWQIGWITDYLMAELTVRSEGNVTFPRGFFTPKVGPHASYGFAPGSVYGDAAELGWGEAGVDNPAIDCVIARAVDSPRVYLLLMNEVGREHTVTLAPDAASLTAGRATAFSGAGVIGPSIRAKLDLNQPLRLTVPAYGLTVVALDYTR